MNRDELSLETNVCDPDQRKRELESRVIDEPVLSLKQRGQLVPGIVVPEEGGYTMLDGESRCRAAKEIGLSKLRVVDLDP